MNRRGQGDYGEMSAMEWLVGTGAKVALPVGHSPDWDLVAECGEKLVRVQVKTSRCWRNDRWDVTICTRGGNRSWGGVVKRFEWSRCDYLFVLVGDGRRWFIPAARIESGLGLRLGGPKYAMFEVERGRPIPDTTPPDCQALESASAPGGAPELESRAGL